MHIEFILFLLTMLGSMSSYHLYNCDLSIFENTDVLLLNLSFIIFLFYLIMTCPFSYPLRTEERYRRTFNISMLPLSFFIYVYNMLGNHNFLDIILFNLSFIVILFDIYLMYICIIKSVALFSSTNQRRIFTTLFWISVPLSLFNFYHFIVRDINSIYLILCNIISMVISYSIMLEYV